MSPTDPDAASTRRTAPPAAFAPPVRNRGHAGLRHFRIRRRIGMAGQEHPGPAGSDSAPGPLPARRRRGIYLLPNAFTTGGLFAGFYAIVMAMSDQFIAAAIAIFVAMLLDSLDGRVARMTNTQSAFGEQYDSLADMVSFGAAPALVVYAWSLKSLGKFGWLAAFVYVAGAALRLARFNTNLKVVDKRWFQGLPSPAAAALVAGLVWIANDLNESGAIESSGLDLSWLTWLITVYAGVTMVSNAPFYSFKDINLKRSVPFIFLFAIVLIYVLISSYPPLVLFALFMVYGVSGYGVLIWRRMAAPVDEPLVPAQATVPTVSPPAPVAASLATGTEVAPPVGMPPSSGPPAV